VSLCHSVTVSLCHSPEMVIHQGGELANAMKVLAPRALAPSSTARCAASKLQL